jgi:hypothetical protein
MAWPGMCVEHGLGVRHGFSSPSSGVRGDRLGYARPALSYTSSGIACRSNRRLRSATVRFALHRRWFEWRLRRVPVEPYGPLTAVGTERGGWMVPAGTINGAWTCYCIGAGSDLAFDLELIRRYGATVRSVDPENALRREAEPDVAADPRLTVIEATVAPHDGASESGETASDGREPPRTLRSLMEQLGDQQVQLLKLNIGGDEYGLLETLDLRSLGVRVLLVRLHAVDEALTVRRTFQQVRRTTHAAGQANGPPWVGRLPGAVPATCCSGADDDGGASCGADRCWYRLPRSLELRGRWP